MTSTHHVLNTDGSVNMAKATAAVHRARREAVSAGYRWICEALRLAMSNIGLMAARR